MNATVDKPRLWSYRDAARAFNLNRFNGQRLISELVAVHEIPVQRIGSALGIDRDGLEVLARALKRELPPD